MNENIVAYIKDRYINSKMEPEFAVLVKGEWGCGKTFLVKKILKETYGEKYKDRVIWLSVYGLSSIQQLKQKLFEKIHPILTSKITKIAFATVKAGLKASTTFDFNADKKDDLSFDLSIPDFDLNENGKKLKIKKLLIIDDIERCSIPISELFGFFSEEILEKKVKAIFISNDEKIKKLNSLESEKDDLLNGYKSIKEKIIGMEFEVNPDISNAVKMFIKEIGLKKNEKILSEKVEFVLSNLNYKNLRSIRQAFVFISQILDILEKDTSELDNKYISNVIEYFIALFVQKNNGKIETEDDFLNAIEAYSIEHKSLEEYNQIHKNDNHPIFRYAKVPLKNLYFNFIQKGDFSSDLIFEDYKQWTAPNDKRTPYQKLVSEWFNFSDTDFKDYYNKVKKDFTENKVLNQAMIMGWAELNLELSEQKVIPESADEIKDYFLNYISFNEDKLEVYNVFMPLRERFYRCKSGLSILDEIETALKNKNQKLLRNKIKNRFVDLYSDITTNISKLISFISYGEENSYDYPILSMIDINNFYQNLKICSYNYQVAIYQSFEDRYGKKNNKGTKIEYYPDAEKIKQISDFYKNDTGEIVMSPENAQRKWLCNWYQELYEYMCKYKNENY